ncbi:MAG: DNA mismatch repair protein MutL [Planctomycetota bacterium]|jgi:DNA mismatch repair protein MutL
MTDASEMAQPRIAVLGEVVRNQIAAGEVIERPASLVKELVENALDAGATQVLVELEEGGVKLVRVTDDGCGMGAEDLVLAFEPHATSKLRSPEDLEHIASLGFRGEALASIGSVSRCVIQSRVRGASLGHRIENEGGRRGDVREAGAPTGTSIEVRDLFYNTPARRRFMKRTSTELSRCLDVVQRMALAHEGVGFVVTHGGKRVFDVEASMDFLARIRRTFGAELAESLVEVKASHGTTHLTGYVAPPRFSRRDTSRQMWFLNGRPVRDKVLIRVLKEAYRGFLEEGRQPVGFLRLSLDPALVDVNVHPAMAEVRFRDQRPLFGFLLENLREAIRLTDMSTPGESMMQSRQRRLVREDPNQGRLPVGPSSSESRPFGARVSSNPSGGFGFSPEPRERAASEVREVAGKDFVPPTPQGTDAAAADRADTDEWASVDDLRGPYLQVDKTYIVRVVPDGFEIIDQHALHERMTFEFLRRDVRENKVEVQRLLVPEIVDVSRSDQELLSGHLDSLGRIGIELAVFGKGSMAVHGLPARLRHPDPEGVVRDLIEILGRTGKPPEAEDVIEEVLHSAACRSSIMAGDELSESDIRSLLERARELETDQTCPHSRPTRVKFTLPDLERAFHRR